MTARPRMFFLNLPVRDLKKSMAFFAKLGFGFNPQFTDDKAACMVVGEHAFVMLLTVPFFKTFTRRELCDGTRQTEALCALSCASRAEVDQLVGKAIEAGGRQAMEPMEQAAMYGRSFYDLDGHHWEAFWMDAGAGQEERP